MVANPLLFCLIVIYMFRGHFEHAMDMKGRTSFPSRFRDGLGTDKDRDLVVTPALFEPCLNIYPMSSWEQLEAKIAALPQFDPNVVALRRKYISAAVECEIDKQGRILIPPGLRESAGLSKEVLWAGMGQTMELWSLDQWKSALQMSETDLQQFKTIVAETFRL